MKSNVLIGWIDTLEQVEKSMQLQECSIFNAEYIKSAHGDIQSASVSLKDALKVQRGLEEKGLAPTD